MTKKPASDPEDALAPGSDIGDGDFHDGPSDQGGISDVIQER